jgi:small subunit ribosomal protein S1
MADQKGPEETDDVSFAEALSQFEREHAAPRETAAASKTAEGAIRRGTVVGFSGDFVLVDFGVKAEGVIPAADLKDRSGNLAVSLGDTFDVTVTGRNPEGLVTLSRVKGARPRGWESLRRAFEGNEIIAGRVTGTTKGGLTVDVGERAFLPASRSGTRDPAELEKLVEQEIRVRIIQLEPEDENVVVDRRAVLEEEARRTRDEALGRIEEGQVVRGTVRSLTDYGAFVDIGGIDGLLHVSDISWTHITNPRSELQVGDTLDLKVLRLDRDAGKVSLGLKQMYPDPWEEAGRELTVGDRLHGTVTRLTDFGAFVEVRPGVEGLIHVSEMSWVKRVRKPSDMLKKGEEIEAEVLKMDPAARRLSLGLKQVLGNPWDTIGERYPAGTAVEGTVRRLVKFGAFVEVEEGVDGLVHISDITSEKRLEHPSEVLKVGDKVRAVVVSADAENRRLKLSLKQLEPGSIDDYLREHKPGDRVMGRVVEIAGDTATVQLGEGVEGICAVQDGVPVTSQQLKQPPAESRGTLAAALAAAWKGPLPEAPAPPQEPLREGQLRSFVIERLDPEKKRIELAAA